MGPGGPPGSGLSEGAAEGVSGSGDLVFVLVFVAAPAQEVVRRCVSLPCKMKSS